MLTRLPTWVDAVEHILDWSGSGSGDEALLRKCKKAVEAAYRDIAHTRAWTYYDCSRQINAVAPQTSSTITYTHTGGVTCERQVTLASGTWPSWAQFGILRIGTLDYAVASMESSTVLSLSVNSNPGADLAAGTAYDLYRETYPLPVDFSAMGVLRDQQTCIDPQYLEPNEFLRQKIPNWAPSRPRWYTIQSDENYVGTMALKLYPPPDAVYNYEYFCRRNPRGLGLYQYNTGRATTLLTALTGSSGAAFTSDMIGCAVRFSVNSTNAPTSLSGTNPYVAQRMIVSMTSATLLGLDQALDSEVAAVRYEISDPIDLEPGAMQTAFLRRCESELAQMMNRDDAERLMKQARDALMTAFEADSRRVGRNTDGTRRRVPLVPEYWTVSNATG